jgi:Ca2+-binding EF-hand superfamily protein
MKHTSPRLRRIQARRLSRQAVAKAGEGVYSKELMASINSRVDQLTAERLAPPMPGLSVDAILVKLQEKVQSLATRSSDQMRQLQRIFGGGANEELRLDAFKQKISKLGVGLTEAQAVGLFERIDTDGSGGISLQEFLKGIMPPDMTKVPWYEIRRREQTKAQEKAVPARGSVNSNLFRSSDAKRAKLPPRSAKVLCDQIYQRIVALSKRPTDQLRRIRRIFALSTDGSANDNTNTDQNEFTVSMLRRQLAKIEVLLSEAEARTLFDHIDTDQSGLVDVQEFLVAVMPKDFTGASFWDKREEERQRLAKARKMQTRENAPRAIEAFRGNAQPDLSTSDIKKILCSKVTQMAKKRSDQIRTITQIFKRADQEQGIDGIDSSRGTTTGTTTSSGPGAHNRRGSFLTREIGVITFKKQIEKLGLNLTDGQAKDLFLEFDKDNSGTVSLQEFLTGVMPIDYAGASWYDKRRSQQLREEKKSKETATKAGKTAFQSGQRPELSVEQCLDMIRARMDIRSTKPSDSLRQIARIFGAAGDCDLATFMAHILKLGINLTQEQGLAIFTQFDTDKSGTVSLLEFIMGIQRQKHLSADSANIFSKQQKAQEERAAAKKKQNRSPNARAYRSMQSKIALTRGIDELKNLIATKIEERSSKPSDQIRQVRRLFARNKPEDSNPDAEGAPSARGSEPAKRGLSLEDFRECLTLFGIATSKTEATALFKSIDADGNGDLSMQELIGGCLPKHFTTTPWWETSRKRQAIIDNAARERERSLLHQVRPTHPGCTVDDIIQVIRVAVESRASRSSDAIRQMIVRLRKNQDTKQVTVGRQQLKQHVKSLGVILTDEQARRLFDRLDVDRSGGVDIMEFLGGMRNDYSGTTYFERRPRSRSNQEGSPRRLGGTRFNRKGQLCGSSMSITAEVRTNPYEKWIPRIPAYMMEGPSAMPPFLAAKQQQQLDERPTAASSVNLNELDSAQCATSGENKNATGLLPSLPQAGASLKATLDMGDRLISPRQKKLQYLLRKSLGTDDNSSSQKRAGKIGSTSKRGRGPDGRKKNVSSPRTWTSVLRRGQRGVWSSTGDQDQVYGQHIPRRPPGNKANLISLLSPRYDAPPAVPNRTRFARAMRR